MSLGTIRGLIRKLKSKESLAPLLVLTVLVCHGAFGAMHTLTFAPYPSTEERSPQVLTLRGGESADRGLLGDAVALFLSPLTATHERDGELADGAGSVLSYVAALFLVSTVVFLPWARGLPSWHNAPPSPPFQRPQSQAPPCHLLGPTASTLQVYRL
jgi:hypothetical protein